MFEVEVLVGGSREAERGRALINVAIGSGSARATVIRKRPTYSLP